MSQTAVVNAAEILDPAHPLHKALKAFCGDREPTKRAARKFLQRHPQYSEVKRG